MTINEFLVVLSEAQARSKLVMSEVRLIVGSSDPINPTTQPGIRWADGKFCPLTFLAYEQSGVDFNLSEWSFAAAGLGLTMTDGRRIMKAADGQPEESALREQLLQAVRQRVQQGEDAERFATV